MKTIEGQTVLSDDDKYIVEEFCTLLESSKQLFNGLRDLPQHGKRQWQPHFAKTFETYTKLWKFQQENRLVLDRSYSLRRWEIGEIASKIGQLYYHYYLRTSETNYLNEAYQFYSAIRARNYYKNVHKEESPEILLKKHRYYARFIVVCLLLNYKKEVANLVKDFSKQVHKQRCLLQQADDNDWEMVVKEIEQFPDSDPVQVLNAETYVKCHLTMRLSPCSTSFADKSLSSHLSLGDVIIVGNSPLQMKFSELTIDMFRMVQVLEWAPGAEREIQKHFQKQQTTQKEFTDPSTYFTNPHKYLLYRPTFFQLYTYLSTAIKELSPGQALLLYISAQGGVHESGKETNGNEVAGYQSGGVITNSKDLEECHNEASLNNIHCLHPADLYPFMRKPMLIIVDSDHAVAFSNLPDLFGQPVLCLMAPDELPNSMKDPCFRLFLGDDFLRVILLRFAFFYCTLRHHRAYKDARFYPKSWPLFPGDEFVNNPVIGKAILNIAGVLGVKGLFFDSKPT